MPIREDFLLRIKKNDASLITLDLSNQKLTVDDIKILLASLAKNTHLQRLNLENNSIGDEGACLLASQLRISELNIKHNNLSDTGLSKFANNDFLDAIHLKGNTYSFKTLQSLTTKTKLNFQAKICKLAETLDVIAQCQTKSSSLFSRLPTELIFYIAHFLGFYGCIGKRVEDLAKLVIENHCEEDQNKKYAFWKKTAEKYFQYPTFFSIPTAFKLSGIKDSVPKEENRSIPIAIASTVLSRK